MKKALVMLLAVALVLAMLPAVALAASGDVKTITTSEELAAAIASQEDNQTWNLAPNKTFTLSSALVATYASQTINSQSGFIFPITANGLTIKGGTGTVITSDVVIPENVGGNWHYQNFITIGGNNVTLDGLTLIPNRNEYYAGSGGVNKLIEVLGTGSVIRNIRTQPRSGDFSGSIYYSNSGSNDVLENVYLNKGRVSLTGKSGGSLTMTNVTIDFSNALGESPDFLGFQPKADVSYTITNTKLIMSQHRIDLFENAVNPPPVTLIPADDATEITATVDPTYTIVIPASVNFGTLQKGTGTETRAFNVKAQNLLLESGKSVIVKVNSNYLMHAGAATLAYLLSNEDGPVSGPNAQFAAFTANGTKAGEVSVNKANIQYAGNYMGTMIFTISYQ